MCNVFFFSKELQIKSDMDKKGGQKAAPTHIIKCVNVCNSSCFCYLVTLFGCYTATWLFWWNVWNIWAAWTRTWSQKAAETPFKRHFREDATGWAQLLITACCNLAVTVVVFSLRPFPLHHSPSCFDLHWTRSLFSSPDPSLRLNLVIRKMLRSAVTAAFTTSPLNLSREVRLNRQVLIYLASAPFGCVLVLASKTSRISFYIWSRLTRRSGVCGC